MIQKLSHEGISPYGALLAPKDRPSPAASPCSIPLSPDQSAFYQTVAPTWLRPEQGLGVLSLSLDGTTFRDFFLDTPLQLKAGVHFSLTALQGAATAELAAFSQPRSLGTKRLTQGFTIRPRLRVDCLHTLYYQEREPGFFFPGEAHGMTELLYVDRGSVHSVAEGRDLLLHQGDLVLYTPGQWHMHYADPGVAPGLVRLTFDAAGRDLSPLCNRILSSPQRGVPLLRQMLQEQERGDDYSQDLIHAHLSTLLLTLLREADNAPAPLQTAAALSGENEIIRRAQQFIAREVYARLSVPIVARGSGVSPSYLTALFQKHLQISPGEYIRRLKLQQSKQLLREGNMTITQISEALHYSTIHHFSRQFKDKFGISPTEYAKSFR